jgi:hypothetical protein
MPARHLFSFIAPILVTVLHGFWATAAPIVETMLNAADVVESSIDKAADKLDMMLAGKRYTRRRNTSHAHISQVVTWSEGGEIKTSTDFGLNLRLPNFEDRWQARFSSYDERSESRDMRQRQTPLRPRQRDPGAALSFLRRLGKIRTSFQPRLELKDPLEVSYVLKFESNLQHHDLHINPRLDFFADPRHGVGQFTSLEVVIPVSRRSAITVQNDEEYRDKDNGMKTNHGISYEYTLNDSKGIGFSVVSSTQNRPAYHLRSFSVASAFTHEIVRRRLSYQVIPFLAFEKSRHFKGEAGITLNTELTF